MASSQEGMEAAMQPAGSLNRFMGSLAGAVNPMNLVRAVASPVDTVKGILQAHKGEFEKSGQAFQEGRYSEGLGHGLAGALPIVGPGAAAIGEQIGSGDVAGGLGSALPSLIPAGALAGVRAAKIPARLKSGAQKQFSQALGATKEGMKRKSQRVVPKLIEHGAKGSRAKLLKTAEKKFGKALEDLKSAEAKIPEGTRVKIEPIFDWLEKKKQKMVGARTATGEVIGNEAGFAQLERMQELVIDLGDDVPYETLVNVRRVLDREVAEAGGFFGKSLKDTSKLGAKQEASNAIRRELAKERPDIARINAEFSLWKTTAEILEETGRRTSSQSTPLGQQLAQAAGGAGGLAVGGATLGTGGALGGAIGGAMLFKGIKTVVQSPTWKTISAIKKKRLADAIVSGKTTAVAQAMGAIVLGGQGQAGDRN